MAAKKGKRLSDETRRKISEAAKKRYARMSKDEKKSEKAIKSMSAARHKKSVVSSKERWDDFLVVFESNMGMITKATKAFGCTTADVYRRLAVDDDFKRRYQEIRKAKLLEVEDQLFKAIDKGDVNAIKFYLQCNGYSPSQKVEAEVKSTILTIDPFGKK